MVVYDTSSLRSSFSREMFAKGECDMWNKNYRNPSFFAFSSKEASPLSTICQSFIIIILSSFIESRSWKLCEIIIIVLPLFRHMSIFCLRSSRASTSSPESISSRMIKLGFKSSIWSISSRLFSPPENHMKRSLSSISFSRPTSLASFSMSRRKTNGEGTLVPS